MQNVPPTASLALPPYAEHLLASVIRPSTARGLMQNVPPTASLAPPPYAEHLPASVIRPSTARALIQNVPQTPSSVLPSFAVLQLDFVTSPNIALEALLFVPSTFSNLLPFNAVNRLASAMRPIFARAPKQVVQKTTHSSAAVAKPLGPMDRATTAVRSPVEVVTGLLTLLTRARQRAQSQFLPAELSVSALFRSGLQLLPPDEL
jgi:hypothetical protein